MADEQADIPAEAPVRVTGEQRPHPALRTLGRACIALARWQQARQQTPSEPSADDTAATGDPDTPAATDTPAAPGEEGGHD